MDELSIWLHPVVVGSGTPLFRPGACVPLRLQSSTPRASGVVALTYLPGVASST